MITLSQYKPVRLFRHIRCFTGDPMTEEPNYDYSPTHYLSLSELEQTVIKEVAIHLTGELFDLADAEALAMTFNILRPCACCVPEEKIHTHLPQHIHRHATSTIST